MNKKIIYIFFLVSVAVFASVQTYAMDYPHNASTSVSCEDCHYIWGSEPSLMIEGLSYGLNIDDTHYNALCWSCHDNITAPLVETHSSLQTDNGYGDWTVECRACHDPHGNNQFRTYGSASYIVQGVVSSVNPTTLTLTGAGWTNDQFQDYVLVPNVAWDYNNYRITGNTSDTLTVAGTIDETRVSSGDTFAIIYGKLIRETISTPSSGTKAVRFFNTTGTNSYADGDAAYDGVCEVCHTQTTQHRNDVSGDHTHNAGLDCVVCHKHTQGFKAACDICHGNPPTVNTATGGPDGLANDPGVTGSSTAGAHNVHVNTKSLACTVCHYNSAGTGATHNNALTITMGFYLFNGAEQGGSYDGQSGVSYNATTTSPVTSVSSNDNKTCSSIYCHSTGQSTVSGSDSTPTYVSPVWDNPASGACGTCHKVSEGAGLSSGSHEAHLGTTGVAGCAECHTGAENDASAYNSGNHINNSIDVANSYDAGGSPGNGYGKCSTGRCHDDGIGNPELTPDWGTPGGGCSECHVDVPATGSHVKHVTTTQYNTADCGDCHNGAVRNTTAPAQHIDGDIDVYDSSAGDLGYGQDVAKGGAPYGSCSTAYCHSTGQSTSDGSSSTPTYATVTWGDSAACGTCHKVTEASGLTSGSHAEHLETAGVNGCSDCHTGAADNASAYNSTNHIDSLIDVANTYTAGGAPGNGYGTCSTASCHNDGTGTPVATPVWGQAIACNSCHATNMATLSHDEHLGSTERTIGCGDCHAGAVQGTTKPTSNHNDGENNADNTYTQDAQTYDAVYGTCSTAACHNSGQGTTVPTPVWGQAIACNGCHATTGATLNTGSHSAHMNTSLQTVGCGDCHTGAVAGTTKPTSNHNNGLNNIDTGSYDGGGAYANGYGSCSTAACHGTATWGGAALGCDSCHLGTGDTDNFAWDGTKAVIDSTDWNSAGHGGYGIANLACTDCHSSGVNHNTAANYFRLSNQTNTLCMGCHNSAQGGTAVVDGLEHYGAKHSPTDNGGELCWDCHDPHGDGPIKMIHDKPWMRRDSNGIPTRIADDTTVLFTTTGTEASYVTADLRGVCQICHDQATAITNYFRYNSYPALAVGGASGGYDTGHSGGAPCTDCHDHSAWQGSAECTTCHDGIPGTSYVSRDVVGSDFTQSSRHVFGGTVTNWDCIVCHREGDATEAASGNVSLTSLHKNSGTYVVDMRNVDSINAGWVWDKNNITDAMHTDMDTFCMGCHDSDGASGINVKATDDGVNLNSTRASTPFNSTDDVSQGNGGGTANVAGYERTAVLDVYTQFDTTNPSHHAVRGQAYTSHNANWGNTAWVDRTLKSGDRLISDTVYESATLHCADCHTVEQNAHGGANGFMLPASSIDATCYLCHNSTTYSDNKSSDTRWDHSNDGGVWDESKGSKLGLYGANTGSICLNCHGGNPVTDGFGGIHGLSSGTDPRSSQQRYRFQGGSYMSHDPGSWTGTSGSATCYFASGTKNQDWSGCTQHQDTEAGRTASPQYSRGVPGDY